MKTVPNCLLTEWEFAHLRGGRSRHMKTLQVWNRILVVVGVVLSGHCAADRGLYVTSSLLRRHEALWWALLCTAVAVKLVGQRFGARHCPARGSVSSTLKLQSLKQDHLLSRKSKELMVESALRTTTRPGSLICSTCESTL
jgi:hypothetical protein